MLLVFVPQLALGANRTWGGGSLIDANWLSIGNWDLLVPVAGDSLFFGGTVQVTNNNNTAADTSFAGITFNSSAGTFTLGGNRITLGGDVLNNSTSLQTIDLAMILSATRTFTTSASGGDLTIGGVLSETGGARGIIKAGAGTLTLSGANTYTGTTTINAGTLKVDNKNMTTARLASTSGITVNSGGTLLLAQSGTASTDRINNSATMTLNGGTFNTGGFSEGAAGTVGVGALTLQANSTIDLGAGASILHFADSSGQTWTSGKILEIDNWSGLAAGGGTDQLIFGSSSGGLTSGQLAEIQFLNPAGFSAGTYGATILSNGEVVPVPEPSTYASGILALAVIGFGFVRRARQHKVRGQKTN